MRARTRHLAVLLALAILAVVILLLLTPEPAGGPAGGGPGAESGRGSSPPAPAPVAPPPTPPVEENSAPRPVEPEEPKGRKERARPEALPESVAARILDDATDAPVKEARVLLALPDGSWFGDRTGALGKFQFAPRELLASRTDLDLASLRLEIRVRAPGHRDFRFDARELRGDIRLVRDETPPAPGTVRGTARGPDGTPWTGRLYVEGFDQDFGAYLCQWCWAAADGSFAMHGVPAGPWRMRVSGAKGTEIVQVPEGGEVWVNLVVPAGGPELGTDDRFGPAEREVRVSGLPPGGGGPALLRCENRPGHYFREPVVGGACTFPAIPEGRWTLALERPGREDLRLEIAVEAGDGPLAVAWK